MSDQTVYQENVFFKPMRFLYQLINSQIKDVNEERSSNADPHAKQWIFPDVPEAEDENYPRIALVPGSISLEEYGGGRFIETVTDDSGNTTSETRGVIARIPMTVGVFVKKKQKFNVDLLDGTSTSMQNTKLSDYMGYQLLELFVKNRPDFIQANIDIENITSTQSYDDGQFWYAKEVNFDLVLWMAIEEKFDPASLIAQIDLTFNVADGDWNIVDTVTASPWLP